MKKAKKTVMSPEDQVLYDQMTEFINTQKPDPVLLNRLIGVRFYLANVPVSVITSAYCIGSSTLYDWVKIARKEGIEGLKRKAGSGRIAILTSEEKSRIDKVLLEPPENQGFRIWDGKTLSEYIFRAFGKKLSVRTCQRLFHELEFSYRKPRSRPAPLRPNEEEREQFKLLIQEINGDPTLILVFEDEVHFLAQAKTGQMWIKKGMPFTVLVKPGRDKVSYLGFLTPETGELLAVEAERFTYETMITALRTFLEQCPPPEGKRYCIVFDNAPWHAKMNRLIWTEELPEYADIREKIVPVFLPPYSPDLNPIELIWRLTRREVTNNRTFNSKEELSDSLNAYFSEHKEPNEQFKKAGSFSCYAYKNNNEPDKESKIESDGEN